MRRPRNSEQHRPDRQSAARSHLQQIERNVRGVEGRHDQQIGVSVEPPPGKHSLADFTGECRIAVHFAIDFEVGLHGTDQGKRRLHLSRLGVSAGTKVGVRE